MDTKDSLHNDAWRAARDIVADCSGCGEFITSIDQKFLVDGEPVCRECIKFCPECGEPMDDATKKVFGPVVKIRRYENDGKMEQAHAECAASYVIAVMCDLDRRTYMTEDDTKQNIAGLVERARIDYQAVQ